METAKTETNLPLNKMTAIQKSIAVNIALGLMLIAACFLLPPIGNPTPQEAKFIEVGYLNQEIAEKQAAWEQAELEQKDYNAQVDADQVQLSKDAQELRTKLETTVSKVYSQAGDTEDFR